VNSSVLGLRSHSRLEEGKQTVLQIRRHHLGQPGVVKETDSKFPRRCNIIPIIPRKYFSTSACLKGDVLYTGDNRMGSDHPRAQNTKIESKKFVSSLDEMIRLTETSTSISE
jgi:hypothetical protein